MRFYSGFAMSDDERLFDAFLDKSDYSVAGFSYGAIAAFESVYSSKTRIDKLQLFSPAFFQNRRESFKKLQLSGYERDSFLYIDSFLDSCFHPYQKSQIPLGEHNIDELRELLYYIWDIDRLQKLAERGVEIEVYLGEMDAIIDSATVREFFTPFATTYFIKGANHFLYRE